MDAIDVFAGKINRHAQDFSKREQLVSRAFLQYILSIISRWVALSLTLAYTRSRCPLRTLPLTLTSLCTASRSHTPASTVDLL